MPMLRALLVSLLLAGCDSLFYYPSRREYAPPEALKIRYEDHEFESAAGVRLHGRLFKAFPDSGAKGLFVLFHGNAQNLTAHYLQFAWVLARGYDLFAFDYPGYGRSGGEPTRRSTIESGRAALEYVSDHLMPPRDRDLVIVGESLGGAIMLECVPDWKGKDRATLILAESTFPSYRGAARGALASGWLTWPLQPLAYVLVSEGGSPARDIARIAPTPLLAADCLEDPVVAPRLTREVYALAREPKWLWQAPACGHIQVFKTQERRDRLLALVDSLGHSREAKHVR